MRKLILVEITPTYDTRASKHRRVRQSVNHIYLKTIALKKLIMNLVKQVKELLNMPLFP